MAASPLPAELRDRVELAGDSPDQLARNLSDEIREFRKKLERSELDRSHVGWLNRLSWDLLSLSDSIAIAKAQAEFGSSRATALLVRRHGRRS